MTFTTRLRFGAAVVVTATALTVAAPAWAAAPAQTDPTPPASTPGRRASVPIYKPHRVRARQPDLPEDSVDDLWR